MIDIKSLMQLSAEKAIKECTWESIEFLFNPLGVAELLLRYDYEGAKKLIYDALTDDSPSAMPWRFRSPCYHRLQRSIEIEDFYRALKKEHEKH